jgi:hypothetical protein
MQRGSPFLVSLAANILLAGAVIFLMERKPAQEIVAAIPDHPMVSLAPASSNTSAETKPFRWSQLESADYPTYIANLRGIGCPEQTLRDIITADVGSLYAQKRRELGFNGDPATAGHWSRQEETEVINTLLGTAQSDWTLEANTNATSSPPDRQNSGESGPVKASLPLAFVNVDTNTLELGESQQAVLDAMRRRFVDEIGGTNQDPNDPQYAERWQQAQPEIDARLKVMLGYETYRQFQRQAWRTAH